MQPSRRAPKTPPRPFRGVRARTTVQGLFALVALAGCLQRELTPLIPCTVSGVALRVNVENVDKVDLLMVIDNSGSMVQEQRKLQDQLPRLIETLASGGRNDEAIADFPPVKDLRVGVITTDLGTGDYNNTNCDDPRGDDGLLITKTGTVTLDSNMTTVPPGCDENGYGNNETFISFIPPDDEGAVAAEAAEFAQRVGCVALVGAGGCGFEQQLEAPLKALTPATSDLVFAGGTKGNGTMNDFVREDSLLAVLLVTDEEDCSASDYRIFDANPETTAYPLPNANSAYHNVHCYIGEAPEKALHPVQRYVDGLLALRATNPALLVFAGIVGLPDGYDEPDANGRVRFDDILADPKMTYTPEQIVTGTNIQYALKPSCDAGEDGDAAPPVRIVEAAKGLDAAGASVTLKSICAPDYAPALDAIITKIADALGGQCLPRPLNPDASGFVNCDVLEKLPAGQRCEDLGKGRTFLRTEGKGEAAQEVCRIAQLPARSTADADATTGEGWFYEYDLDEEPNGPGGEATDLEARCGQGARRVTFTKGAEPDTGSQILLECLQSVQESAPTDNDVGGFCTDPGATCPAGGQLDGKACLAPVDLLCDPKTRLWQVPCSNDAACAPFVCDTVTREGTSEDPYVCVNPTCG